MSHPDTTNKDAALQQRGIPQPGQLLPLELQHVVAAIVGVVTPAILVAGTCGLGGAGKTLVIQASLILTALVTLLQLSPISHRTGSSLPVVMGISFAYVPTFQVIGGESDLPTIPDTGIVGGIVAIVFGVLVKWIRLLFPPLITGTVIFTIGLSLYPTTIKYMAGGAGSEWFGSAKNWAVVLIASAVVAFLDHFTESITRLASILVDILAGYVATYSPGIVDLSGMGSAVWVALPRPMPSNIQFVSAACVSLGIVYVVNAMQTIGDLSSTTMDGMDRMPTDKEFSGDTVGQSVTNILGTFFGGLLAVTYSQNVGIVTVNRVINQVVFALAALILLMAGLVPKFASLLTTIPQCVVGGATIPIFAATTMAGICMTTEGGFTPRKSFMVGLSIALSVGITQVFGCLAGEGFPTQVNTVFGSSSVVVAVLMIILLNLILPKEPLANG